MKKENIKEYTFYRWIEENTINGYKMDDICFIVSILKDSSPGNFQCDGIEIESIDSDLIVGNNYIYHFLYSERAKDRKYTIKEISIDDIDKKQFFEWLFDYDSKLNIVLRLEKKYRKQ